MIFKQFFDETSSTLTYILAMAKGKEALIIDPVVEKTDEYLKFIGDNNLRLVKALDTHVHADHISGLAKLRDITRCITMMGKHSPATLIARRLEDGEKIKIEGLELTTWITPGHTNDSTCFYMNGMIFTGDTLFIRGCGRTDFQSGNSGELYDSIQRIFSLPKETVIFPGHDYKGETISTVEREIATNVRLRNRSKEDFIHLMDNLNLPNPKLMDVAVPANIKLGDDVNSPLASNQVIEASEALEKFERAVFIDLREDHEIKITGAIKNAKIIHYHDLFGALADSESELSKAITAKKEIVFYCEHGERSALALHDLFEKGVENLFHIKSGIYSWIEAKGPVTK